MFELALMSDATARHLRHTILRFDHDVLHEMALWLLFGLVVGALVVFLAVYMRGMLTHHNSGFPQSLVEWTSRLLKFYASLALAAFVPPAFLLFYFWNQRAFGPSLLIVIIVNYTMLLSVPYVLFWAFGHPWLKLRCYEVCVWGTRKFGYEGPLNDGPSERWPKRASTVEHIELMRQVALDLHRKRRAEKRRKPHP